MGLIHRREYEEIIQDLTAAILQIRDLHLFFAMETKDWDDLLNNERKELALTMADDLFYALDEEHELRIGKGRVIYLMSTSTIEVYEGHKLIETVRLN